MAYTATTWVEGVTTLGPTNMNKIETELVLLDQRSLAAAPSATPPGSPVDGQLWLLPADATNGVIWQFRYNSGSASTYKWEFVGGLPLHAELQADASTASTTYFYVTANNIIVLPRNGDYLFEWGAYCYGDSATQRLAYLCPNGGAFTASDTNAIAWYASTAFQGRGQRRLRANAMTAGALGLAARTVSATTSWSGQFFSVTPFRVS